MPQVVEDFVRERLNDPEFYKDRPESERKSLAFAIATKMYKEGKLKASEAWAFFQDLLEKFTAPFLSSVSEDDLIRFSQVNAPAEISLEASDDGTLLIFKNAILCRAEQNRNRDEVLPEGITELAASIAGRPIDVEHDPSKNSGVFTAGRPVLENTALSVDGIIWVDRYPREVEEVKSGQSGLSVEATAKKAICSVCHGEFDGADDYCEHLLARRKTGATRTLKGLKAKGGAITRNPAGTDTKFNPASIYLVASHQEDLEMDRTDIETIVRLDSTFRKHGYFLSRLDGKPLLRKE